MYGLLSSTSVIVIVSCTVSDDPAVSVTTTLKV